MAAKKRGGYVTLILLVSAMLFIMPLLAVTSAQLIKFRDLAHMLSRQKQERAAVLKSINESFEFLRAQTQMQTQTKYPAPDDTLVNPASSAELLVREVSETTEEHTLSSEIYSMNYVISGDMDLSYDAAVSDIFKFPPSRKNDAAGKYFLIRTTVHKKETPSYREETAVAITSSGNADRLWSREIVLF